MGNQVFFLPERINLHIYRWKSFALLLLIHNLQSYKVAQRQWKAQTQKWVAPKRVLHFTLRSKAVFYWRHLIILLVHFKGFLPLFLVFLTCFIPLLLVHAFSSFLSSMCLSMLSTLSVSLKLLLISCSFWNRFAFSSIFFFSNSTSP